MEDILVKMIVEARKKLNVKYRDLANGICTEEMLKKVCAGKKSIDRVTVKRLLARLGVDNANYGHYLEYPDYDKWRERMRIISAIEEGKVDEAEVILEEYYTKVESKQNISREKIEKQFYIFMKLQIMRHSCNKVYEENALKLYSEALKETVPNIDDKPLSEFCLSPLEFALALEYNRRANVFRTEKDVFDMYKVLFLYIHNAPYGRVSLVKIYPKVVVCLYDDVKDMMKKRNSGEKRQIYSELLKYCDIALNYIKERKFMNYLTEILCIQQELLANIAKESKDNSKVQDIKKLLKELKPQLETLKNVYEEYGIEPYMKDDCYLYRESGMYCISDVLKERREMKKMSQEELCTGICDVRTLKSAENKERTTDKEILKELFGRLGLVSEYINTRIVSDKMEAIELYEDLRYAENAFNHDCVEEKIKELKKVLPEHPVNTQILARVESLNQWRLGNKTTQQHIDCLKRALGCTVDINILELSGRQGNISFTAEEVVTLYLISTAYRKNGEKENALEWIKPLWYQCEEVEKDNLVESQCGIYQLIMMYVASLLGDMGEYEKSNSISDKLTKICLKLRWGGAVHRNFYNKTWNNKERKLPTTDHKSELKRCINLCELIGDSNDKIFYNKMIKEL